MDQNLAETSYVWVRKEGIRPSLSPIYDGPYYVVRKYDKYFVILSWQGEKKISVDRLKTAYICEKEQEQNVGSDDVVAQQDINLPRRSKRIIKEPDRLNL